jgi:signal peptidase II
MRWSLPTAVSLIVLFVFIDQLTKMWAGFTLAGQPITLIPSVLRLELVYNTGMAFGLLANGRILFLIISVLALVIGWKYYKVYYAKSPLFYWAGILFFAGTLGNFFDRLFYGKVTDFIALGFGFMPFPVFNVADMLLCLSVAIGLLAVIFDEQAKEES